MKASLTKSMLLVCISNQNVTLFGTKVRNLSETAKDNMHKNEADIEHSFPEGLKNALPRTEPKEPGTLASVLGRTGLRPREGIFLPAGWGLWGGESCNTWEVAP
jgi:hypothetical protein